MNTTTTANRTTFAANYMSATAALMDTIALIGTDRTRQWFHAADEARKALDAAGTPEEAHLAKQLIIAIYMTEVS